MLSNLVSLISKSFSGNQIAPVAKPIVKSNNPFGTSQSNNPFLSTTYGESSFYGKNNPIEGGYFAGYYNGKPNIVGRKLFIEI